MFDVRRIIHMLIAKFSRCRFFSSILKIIHVAAAFILIAFAFKVHVWPKSDDWAYALALNLGSVSDFIAWLFEQHVDHRIPIQKFIQYWLARFSGYDFRVLILFNIIIAFLASWSISAAARIYRGYQHHGDLIIPLILLLPAAEYSSWAFALQFLSSVFFIATALYFACRYTRSGQTSDIVLLLVQLALCGLCGLNGAISSTVLICGIVAYFALRIRQQGSRKYYIALCFLALVLIENAAIWLLWNPSSASNIAPNFSTILELFLMMLPSSMAIFMFDGTSWKIATIIALLLLAIYTFVRRAWQNNYEFSDWFLFFGLVACLVVILSIAIARSKIHPEWNVSLAIRYGYLATLLPIMAWILISKGPNTRVGTLTTSLVGLSLVILFGAAYIDNYQWRHRMMQAARPQLEIIYHDMNSLENTEKLVDKHILSFNWSDAPVYKKLVINGIDTLRRHDYPLYTVRVDSVELAREGEGGGVPPSPSTSKEPLPHTTPRQRQ